MNDARRRHVEGVRSPIRIWARPIITLSCLCSLLRRAQLGDLGQALLPSGPKPLVAVVHVEGGGNDGVKDRVRVEGWIAQGDNVEPDIELQGVAKATAGRVNPKVKGAVEVDLPPEKALGVEQQLADYARKKMGRAAAYVHLKNGAGVDKFVVASDQATLNKVTKALNTAPDGKPITGINKMVPFGPS
jgi:hypothetical protein